MSNNNFDFSELTDFSKDLLDTAQSLKNGKESKKFMKKEGKKLTKIQKKNLKSSGVLAGSGMAEQETLKNLKTGKVYKRDGYCVRAYGSGLNNIWGGDGFLHKGGKDKKGKETWIVGGKYIAKSENEFKDDYYKDTEDWIDKLLDDGLL